MVKLNADQLRKYPNFAKVIDREAQTESATTGEQVSSIKYQAKKLKRNEIYIILDNVLDTYNIGSIFRLADAVAAKKIFLCAGSETPPNPRIKKASINTTEWVEWEYCETAVEAIARCTSEVKKMRLHLRGVSALQVMAIEQSPKSVPYDKFDYKLPIALIVGHESEGVSPEVLKLCDAIVELPMFGINISLNVMVSLGIVLYRVLATRSA